MVCMDSKQFAHSLRGRLRSHVRTQVSLLYPAAGNVEEASEVCTNFDQMTAARAIRHTTTGKCVSSLKVAAGTKQFDASLITLPCRQRLALAGWLPSLHQKPQVNRSSCRLRRRRPAEYCSSHKPRETQKRPTVEGDSQRQKDLHIHSFFMEL